MALETATYIDGLVATNPAASDAISTADDHIRLIKSTIKATFPSITGPVTKTQAEINGLAPLASPTFTGTPTAPTAAAGTNTTQVATTAFVKDAVDTATGSLGTMSTQNANSVSITGGSVAGITDLAVADGGTGASSITANSVVLGNGTSALNGNLVAPGTSGNALVSDGTTWASGSPAKLSTASGSAPSYSARAWVNFNGTGTVAIRASGNVSSITDNGTGDYTVNFTTAMSDANYTALTTQYDTIPNSYFDYACAVGNLNASNVKVICQINSGSGFSAADAGTAMVAIFR